MGGAKLLKWRLAAEGAKLLKSGAALILSIPRCDNDTVSNEAHILDCETGCGAAAAIAHTVPPHTPLPRTHQLREPRDT